MQKFTQKYALVHLIKDLPDGYEYSMDDWPLHVTLADVFAIQGTSKDLINDLAKNLSLVSDVDAKVMGDEWFGEDKTVHVKLLEKTDRLQALHEKILEVLNSYQVKFNNPEHVNEGFRPHSTVRKDEKLESGEVVVFDSVTLIDMFPNENPRLRRVLGTIHNNKNKS